MSEEQKPYREKNGGSTIHFIKFNMDVLVTPIKVVYNDEVKDLTEAKKVLEKFTLKRIK